MGPTSWRSGRNDATLGSPVRPGPPGETAAAEAVTAMTGTEDNEVLAWQPAALSVPDGQTRASVLEELFRVEYHGLIRLAYVIVGERTAAEDAVMEAFCALHRNWSRVRDRSAPQAYLRAAVVLGCRSHVRRLVRERRRPPVWEVGRPDPSGEDALAQQARDTVLRAIRELPHRQREVVVCRYYLDLTETQTAELLSISVGSVKRHHHRAKQALADRLEVRP